MKASFQSLVITLLLGFTLVNASPVPQGLADLRAAAPEKRQDSSVSCSTYQVDHIVNSPLCKIPALASMDPSCSPPPSNCAKRASPALAARQASSKPGLLGGDFILGMLPRDGPPSPPASPPTSPVSAQEANQPVGPILPVGKKGGLLGGILIPGMLRRDDSLVLHAAAARQLQPNPVDIPSKYRNSGLLNLDHDLDLLTGSYRGGAAPTYSKRQDTPSAADGDDITGGKQGGILGGQIIPGIM